MHGHHHGNSDDQSSARIGWAFCLNFGFTIVEFIGGVLTNSTAIMADAVHDLGDSISLGAAWVLNKLGQRPGNDTYTYGYRRLTLFGALINGLILTLGSVWVLTHSIPRLFEPTMPVAEGMIALAIAGVAVNGLAAWKLHSGRTMNERVLNWHLMEDLLGWVAVLIVAVTLMFVEWPILDPLLSIAFTLFILVNVLRKLWQTAKLFVQATPDPALYNNIRQALLNVPEVDDVHHMHLWSLDGERHVLTAHVLLIRDLDASQLYDLKHQFGEALRQFDLEHTTIETELPREECRDHGEDEDV